MDATNLSDLSDLGGDNKMANTPAEIYANVRNRALEEAAELCDTSAEQWRKEPKPSDDSPAVMAEICARTIRAIKSKPE